MTKDEFEALAADYYDARESEEFSHDAIEDAVAEAVDLWAEPGCDVAALIRRHSPVEVRAFRRGAIEDSWYEEQSTYLLGELAQRWGEEYGNPDDDVDTDSALKLARPLMDAAVRAFVAASNSWQCVEVGSYAYSAEEVEAMMRAHNPHWFEAAPAASAP